MRRSSMWIAIDKSQRRRLTVAGAMLLTGGACFGGRTAPRPDAPVVAQASPPPATGPASTSASTTTSTSSTAAAPPRRDPFAGADLSPKPPVVPLAPSEEAQRFLLPAGYRMTPVLAEPAIQQPATISFDPDGRMYVLELRTYMLDLEARDQLAPVSRISRWEDRDGDGVYETG